ncbi:hypothetical protein CJ739_3627 [Mariniflexile rhizosphaerae]|nr:hypothetical protein CJ739_3627 [Mariniflexile sp. TRM1-10]PLB18907.1 MAG: hypothetical protein TRG1_2261 [Flavobacteriaceae bacterium FS1-H7996/R]
MSYIAIIISSKSIFFDYYSLGYFSSLGISYNNSPGSLEKLGSFEILL